MATAIPIGSRARWVKSLGVFLIHQASAIWGPLFVAPALVILVSEVVRQFGIRTSLPEGQLVLYGAPFFPVQVLLALFVGWLLGGTIPHRAMFWVWVLPLAALCLALVGMPPLPSPPPAYVLFPATNDSAVRVVGGSGIASRLSDLFGWGSGLRPYDQVNATLPLYSAAVYSLGAGLAKSALRARRFFESMRNLRVSRLVLLVALPWFCLKLAINWQQAIVQYPFLRTWPVVCVLLLMLDDFIVVNVPVRI